MNVWTDGDQLLSLGPLGLSAHRADREERLLSEGALGFAASGGGASQRWLERGVLAVSSDTRRAIFVNGQDEAVELDLEELSARALPSRLSAAIGLDAGRFAVLRAARFKGRDVARLAMGTIPEDARGTWALDLDVTRPTRVRWPSVIWKESACVPFSRARCSTRPGDVQLDANRHGVALADSATGTVGVIRPGARSFAALLRVPSQTGSRVWASCTAGGVLVGITLAGGEGAIVHFDEALRVLAAVERPGVGPLHVDDEDRLFYVVPGAGELREAELGGLRDRHVHRYGDARADGEVTLSIGPGSRAVAIGLGRRMVWLRGTPGAYESRALSQPDERALCDAELDANPRLTSTPPPPLERVNGPAQLALDPTRRAPEWHFASGAPFELRVPMISMGGAAKGLYVELAGDAVDRGLISASTVELDGVGAFSATFSGTRPRGEFPECEVAAAAVLPATKKVAERFAAAPDDMFMTVTVRGATKAAGRGLLMVRVGFTGAGTEGSLMRGRAVEVA